MLKTVAGWKAWSVSQVAPSNAIPITSKLPTIVRATTVVPPADGLYIDIAGTICLQVVTVLSRAE
jgi:hypothetical protein